MTVRVKRTKNNFVNGRPASVDDRDAVFRRGQISAQKMRAFDFFQLFNKNMFNGTRTI